MKVYVLKRYGVPKAVCIGEKNKNDVLKDMRDRSEKAGYARSGWTAVSVPFLSSSDIPNILTTKDIDHPHLPLK